MHRLSQINYRLSLNTTIAIFSVFRFDEGRSLQILLSQKRFIVELPLLFLCVMHIFNFKTVLGFLDSIFHLSFIACFIQDSRGFVRKLTKTLEPLPHVKEEIGDSEEEIVKTEDPSVAPFPNLPRPSDKSVASFPDNSNSKREWL